MFRVDEFGFYIYWKSEGREGDVLDLSQVGQAISLMKMFFLLLFRSMTFAPVKLRRKKSSKITF